jgi:hypothetical protein
MGDERSGRQSGRMGGRGGWETEWEDGRRGRSGRMSWREVGRGEVTAMIHPQIGTTLLLFSINFLTNDPFQNIIVRAPTSLPLTHSTWLTKLS